MALNISNNVGINNSIKKAILAATSVVQKKFTSVISKNEYKKINKKIKWKKIKDLKKNIN